MIILVGASASGKTEVAKHLARHFHIKKVITHTTRPMREHEQQDIDYHFVSKQDFFVLKSQNTFVETTQYNGNYYGTSKKEIGDQKCLIVDPNGLHAFQQLHDPHLVTFLLVAEEETRKKRMISRGDSLENVEKRIAGDRKDFSQDAIGSIDFLISTDTMTIEEITNQIYTLYKNKLSQL